MNISNKHKNRLINNIKCILIFKFLTLEVNMETLRKLGKITLIFVSATSALFVMLLSLAYINEKNDRFGPL